MWGWFRTAANEKRSDSFGAAHRLEEGYPGNVNALLSINMTVLQATVSAV